MLPLNVLPVPWCWQGRRDVDPGETSGQSAGSVAPPFLPGALLRAPPVPAADWPPAPSPPAALPASSASPSICRPLAEENTLYKGNYIIIMVRFCFNGPTKFEDSEIH